MAVERATAWAGGGVIFLMMLLVSAQVLSRRLLNAPIEGQVDLTQLAMPAFSLLCVSYCYRQAGHIRMDMLHKLARGRPLWALHLFATLVGLVTVSAVLPGAWSHFMRAYAFGDSTLGVGLPTWPSKLAAPLGLGLLWLRLALELWVFGRLLRDPSVEPIGVPSAAEPLRATDA